MREAGRALALDPHNVGAQHLMMRLMLEIPNPIPRAARDRVEEDKNKTTRTVLVLGARAYLANLVMIPLCKVLGVGGTWPFVVVSIVAAVQAGICYASSRRERPLSTPVWVFLILNHVFLVTLIGTFFGSLLFVPIFVFGSLPIMLMMPQVNRPILVVVCHMAAVAIPLALEFLGVVPSSVHLQGHGVLIEPWAVETPPRVLVTMVLVLVTIQMVVSTRVFVAQRASQERAHERLHAQTWQLEQMVKTE
jgi:hypothetical protein